jgi:hypothetical protein
MVGLVHLTFHVMGRIQTGLSTILEEALFKLYFIKLFGKM